MMMITTKKATAILMLLFMSEALALRGTMQMTSRQQQHTRMNYEPEFVAMSKQDQKGVDDYLKFLQKRYTHHVPEEVRMDDGRSFTPFAWLRSSVTEESMPNMVLDVLGLSELANQQATTKQPMIHIQQRQSKSGKIAGFFRRLALQRKRMLDYQKAQTNAIIVATIQAIRPRKALSKLLGMGYGRKAVFFAASLAWVVLVSMAQTWSHSA